MNLTRRRIFLFWIKDRFGIQDCCIPPKWYSILFYILHPVTFWHNLTCPFDLTTDSYIVEGVAIPSHIIHRWSKGPYPSIWVRVTKRNGKYLQIQVKQDD